MPKLLLLFLLITQNFLFSQEKWKVRLYNEVNNRKISIFVDNDEPMPMSGQFNFELNNLSSTLNNNAIVVIPPNTKRFLIAKHSEIKPYEENSYSYISTFNFGNALQENFDNDYVYSLPFGKGKTQLIFQGYDGNFSHQKVFALDFNLKKGNEIFAAREGLVVMVVKNFDKSCRNISCAKYNNKIIIQHSDGTFADYSHLMWQGAIVHKGDIVKKDQLIGYSGSTGFTSGPHLHFEVFINRIDGKRTYIKTKFKTSESDATFLEEGKSYTKNY